MSLFSRPRRTSFGRSNLMAGMATFATTRPIVHVAGGLAAPRRDDIIKLPTESLTVLPSLSKGFPETLCSVRCINRAFTSL